jgi:RNA polymerase sigma-54 factor
VVGSRDGRRQVELLNREGVDIARRTVVKYRKAMRIPSSFERRRDKRPQAWKG